MKNQYKFLAAALEAGEHMFSRVKDPALDHARHMGSGSDIISAIIEDTYSKQMLVRTERNSQGSLMASRCCEVA